MTSPREAKSSNASDRRGEDTSAHGESRQALSRQRRLLLVAQLSVIQVVAWGALFYAFSAFLPPMLEDLGWSSSRLSSGFSAGLLVSALLAPFVGIWIDRHGTREVMTLASLLGFVGAGFWSFATTYFAYLAAWLLIGVGMAGALYGPAFATVVRLDPLRSRRGILIISLVGALAATLYLPAASVLTEQLGWRAALRLLTGAAAVIVLPLCAALPPSNARPSPTNAPQSTERKSTPPKSSAQVQAFRRFVLMLMIADAASVAFNAHLLVLLVGKGLSLSVAAGIAGIAGIAKIGGRLGTAAADRWPAQKLLAGSLLLQGLAMILPLLWPSTASVTLMVATVGATSGARTILRPAILVEAFGSTRFATTDGYLQLFTKAAKAAGPLGFGVGLGWMGADWTWGLTATLTLFSGVMVSRLQFGCRSFTERSAQRRPQIAS